MLFRSLERRREWELFEWELEYGRLDFDWVRRRTTVRRSGSRTTLLRLRCSEPLLSRNLPLSYSFSTRFLLRPAFSSKSQWREERAREPRHRSQQIDWAWRARDAEVDEWRVGEEVGRDGRGEGGETSGGG